MCHFAYPNINQKIFIGCGRYKAMLPKETGDEYNIVENVPNVPNRKYLYYVVTRLTPESADSERKLYEKKDEEKKYQGDSLHLAYLMAHTSRSRQISLKNRKGDIWCTGSVDKGDSGPFLAGVNEDLFKFKLDAFLNENKNNDRLFIVPSQNITLSLEEKLKKEDAELMSLEEFEKTADSLIFEKKTVLRVRPDELTKLMTVLFETPALEDISPPKSYRNAFIGVIAVFLLVLTAWAIYEIKPDKVSVQEIIACVENGDFSKAESIIQKGEAQENDKFTWFQKESETPVRLMINFEFMKQGYPVIMPSDSPQVAELVLSHTSNYRLIISCNSPLYPMYLYAYQEDYRGKLDPLFPNPDWNPGHNNPIRPSEFPFYIPSDGKWFYLNELSLTPGMKIPKETIYIIASPWRARDVENSFGETQKEVDPAGRKAKISEFVQRLKLRNETAFKSVCYKSFYFRHGR